jgi:hypothetical protein
VSGYVLDDLALGAGLIGTGSEHHRRELSRLLSGAVDGGPSLDVPALCLAAVAALRPALTDHLAEIIAVAPPDAITVSGLSRSTVTDRVRVTHPQLSWSATHATVRALATRLPILTVDPDRYRTIAVTVLSL